VHARNMVVGTLLLAVVGLAGCASKEETPGGGTPTTDPTSATTGATTTDTTTEPEPGNVIDITIRGDSVDPNGTKVDAKIGEPVILAIDSDAPGELHIHSTPEQEIAFAAGKSRHTVTFDRPGVVEVESHDLGKVIVQLQVR
jgi:hypothetical protein